MFIKYSHQAFPSQISLWFISVNFIFYLLFLFSSFINKIGTNIDCDRSKVIRVIFKTYKRSFILILKILEFFSLITIRQKWKQKLWFQLTKYWLKTKFLFERKILFPGWLEVFTVQIPHPLLSSLQYEVVNWTIIINEFYFQSQVFLMKII